MKKIFIVPDSARKMAAYVEAECKKVAYAAITDPVILAPRRVGILYQQISARL